MKIDHQDKDTSIVDKHFAVKCPHCGVPSTLAAVSIPKHQLLQRYRPRHVHIGYRCNACGAAVSLRFQVESYPTNPREAIKLDEKFDEIQRPKEDFELKYLPDDVAADFDEALRCYSESCFNAFAAMCRRALQSAAVKLGAEGSTKVQSQLKDLRSMGVINEEAFDQLKQIMLDGHDGAHPHLPRLTSDRALILLELIKDVMYQLFVRKAKIEEAAALRQHAISGE